MAHPAVLDYLRTLGVTAVELLPVHHFVHDGHLLARASATTGATTRSGTSRRTGSTRAPVTADSRSSNSNRWSTRYTPLALEVILDVVYNHTAEGNHLGPMLSFQGFDNTAYYRPSKVTGAITSITPAPATA
jgi:isoamylase